MPISIAEYVAANATVTPNSDIVSRWESRVVAEGMNTRGRAGADAYLGRYGKGIRSPKVIMLARIAEIKGCAEVAAGFWEAAYALDHGLRAVYSVSGGVAPAGEVQFRAPVLKESFGRNPQILSAVDLSTAMRLARQPNIGVQEKKDGERLMTRTTGNLVVGGNKKGLVAAVPLGVADELLSLGQNMTDGEKVIALYYLFDLLQQDGEDLTSLGCLERYRRLEALLQTRGADFRSVKLVPMAVKLDEKMQLIEELERRGKEGFVLKDLYAPSTPGNWDTQVKYQFRRTNSFIVGEMNPNGRRSVQLFTKRADGSLRDMGFLNIPTSHAVPKPGEIASVKYLYLHRGEEGKLDQAVYEGPRLPGDADADDCLLSKLKMEPVDEES